MFLMRDAALCLACALAFSACASALAPAKPRWPAFPDTNFMHVGGFLQVSGTGRAQGKVTSDAQRMSLGRDTALLDARRRLRSYLEGLALPDGSAVGQKAADSNEYESGLDSLVRSVDIVSTRFDADVTAVVIRLPKTRVNAALGADYQ